MTPTAAVRRRRSRSSTVARRVAGPAGARRVQGRSAARRRARRAGADRARGIGRRRSARGLEQPHRGLPARAGLPRRHGAHHASAGSDGELVITFTIERGPQYRVAARRARPATSPCRRWSSSRSCALRRRASRSTRRALDADRVGHRGALSAPRLRARREVDAVDRAGRRRRQRCRRGPGRIAHHDRRSVRRRWSESVRVEGNASIAGARADRRGSGLQPGRRSSRRSWRSIATPSSCSTPTAASRTRPSSSNPGLSADGTRADVVFTVAKGPQVFVDHVLIVGNAAHADAEPSSASCSSSPAIRSASRR